MSQVRQTHAPLRVCLRLMKWLDATLDLHTLLVASTFNATTMQAFTIFFHHLN